MSWTTEAAVIHMTTYTKLYKEQFGLRWKQILFPSAPRTERNLNYRLVISLESQIIVETARCFCGHNIHVQGKQKAFPPRVTRRTQLNIIGGECLQLHNCRRHMQKLTKSICKHLIITYIHAFYVFRLTNIGLSMDCIGQDSSPSLTPSQNYSSSNSITRSLSPLF